MNLNDQHKAILYHYRRGIAIATSPFIKIILVKNKANNPDIVFNNKLGLKRTYYFGHVLEYPPTLTENQYKLNKPYIESNGQDKQMFA
ncbi:MAG: hypothetical protein M3162_09660 [Thermoproteota archaeon]|nr:hypothetical protein [Thermoproteota archaeon]